jgi:hypothetical protein
MGFLLGRAGDAFAVIGGLTLLVGWRGFEIFLRALAAFFFAICVSLCCSATDGGTIRGKQGSRCSLAATPFRGRGHRF